MQDSSLYYKTYQVLGQSVLGPIDIHMHKNNYTILILLASIIFLY